MTTKSEKPSGSSDGRKQQLKFTPPVRSKEELLQVGREAAQTLGAPVFNLAYKSTIQGLQDEILNSDPREVQRREYLYTKMQALGQVVAELASYHHIATAISSQSLAEEQRNQMAEAEQLGIPDPSQVDDGYNSAIG